MALNLTYLFFPKFNMTAPRILIIAPSWVGDLIISQAFINALKQIHKDSKIDLLVNEDLAYIAKCFPTISNIITSKTRHGKLSLLYRITTGLKLRKNNYSYCYILTNSLKSSIIPFVAGIKQRISYLGEFRYGLINKIIKKIDRKEGMANRYLNLINHKYKPEFRPVLSPKISPNTAVDKFDLKKKYIVLCPDAEFGPAKKWPIKKWIDLANSIPENIQVVFVGLDTSITLAASKIRTNNYINLIGKTSLEDVVIILSQSSCVVSNDSGLMHVAAALGRPVVGIYGSSSPEYTPPLIDNDKKIIVYENLSCSPCFKRTCPLEHMNCLNNISVDYVKESITSLIK